VIVHISEFNGRKGGVLELSNGMNVCAWLKGRQGKAGTKCPNILVLELYRIVGKSRSQCRIYMTHFL
jgi:hypothetical protein